MAFAATSSVLIICRASNPVRFGLLGLMLGCSFLVPVQARAQVAPPSPGEGIVQRDLYNPRASETFNEQARKKRIERGIDAEDGAKAAESRTTSVDAPAGAEKVRFKLKEVTFGESEIFSQADLEGFATPYLNKEISVADLFKITQAINDAYRRQGYVTTQAILPPQQIVAGKVRIALVEGRIGDITVSKAKRLQPNVVIRDSRIKPDTIPTIQLLEQRAAAVNWNRNYQIAAGLQPGKAPGTTDLDLSITNQPPKVSGSVYMDNSGSLSNGRYNLGATASFYSLFGTDDLFSLGFTRSFTQSEDITDESNVGSYFFNASLPMPVGRGNVNFLYSHSNSRVLEGEFASLGIDGRGDLVGLTVTQPFYSTSKVNLSLVAGGQYGNSRSTVGIVDTDTDSWRGFGGIKAQVSLPNTSTYLEGDVRAFSSWVRVKGLMADHSEKRKITRYVASASAYQDLTHGFSAEIKAGGQYSLDKRLPSGEQWYLGGAGTLPAYEMSSLSGDYGYYATSQLRYAPTAFANSFGMDAEIGLRGFFGVGGVYDDYVGVLQDNNFADAGIGLDFKVADHFSGDLSVAWPVGRDVKVNEAKRDSPRLLFSLSANF